MGETIASAVRTHKYAVLLVLLLAALTVQMNAAWAGAAGVWSDVVRTTVSTAVFLVVFERPRVRLVMAAVLVVTIGIAWVRQFGVGALDHQLSLVFYTFFVAFLCTAVWTILRELFSGRAVGVDNVLGAICGYLIAADAWAGVNALAFQLVPAAYSINPEVRTLLADWHGRLALFSYYSFAQMLTIGYADVTPVRAPATTLSLFGALFGIFYTAIVVSQFVNLAQAKREGADRGR